MDGTPRKKPLGVPAISSFQQTPERLVDMAGKTQERLLVL
jgi:hypothetical protein